jgi:hypothetical protein
MAKAKKSLQKSVVDGLQATCPTQSDGSTHSNAGYAKLERSRLIRSADISAMFGKPAGWFARDRTKKSLAQRGFPQSVIWGRWLRTAVEAWLEREGNRSEISTLRARSTRPSSK